MRFAGFIGPSYTLQSVNYDCQRCINLYPEINEIGSGKGGEVASFVMTPGLTLKATLPTSPVRGIYTGSNGVLYAVGGNKMYSLDADYVVTLLGTLTTSEGQVSMADNGTTLAVVDGQDGYGVDMSTGAFAEFTDPDFLPSDKVVFQDGYFIFNEKNTGRFFISGINDTTFDALDFATAEGSPDSLISIISDHRDLWLFGTESIEVFYNSGDALFPFTRIQGAFIEHGCAAAFSVAKMNNEVYWLGRDNQGNGIIYKARGYQPQRISTHAVEYAIREYGSTSDAVAYTYQENGHHFYAITFVGAETTWVYDNSTNLWHERAYSFEGNFQRHRANSHTFFRENHVVGDYENGKIYELDSRVYTDAGEAISRQRVAPHVSQDMNRMFYNSFQLDMEVGVGLDGLTTVQGNDPQAMLEFSDDGGHTWSNEKWASFGKIGRRKQRAIWRRLGYSRDRVFRVTITDPVKIAIIGAQLDIVAGAN